MGIVWFNEEEKEILVTLSPTQITINKIGAKFFENANQVMLGYDEERNYIIIKPLSKEDVLRGDIPEHARYNISNNVSYSRITNKLFLTKVIEIFNIKIENTAIKYHAYWRTNNDTLEISIKEVV